MLPRAPIKELDMPAPTPVPHDPADSHRTDGHPADSRAPEDRPADSTTTAKPSATRGPRALTVPMHRILRTGAIAAAISLPVAAVIGYLVAGVPGVWGALIGMGLAVVFLAVTVLVGLATAHTDAAMLGFAVLGSWLAKIIVLIVVLALLRGKDFYAPGVLFVALLVGIAGTLLIEWRVVSTTKVPYVESGSR